MSERPELIELFLTDLEKFQKKFNLILKRTPNIAISKDSGFFIDFFLGALLALPDMNLMKKIGIKKILLKKENEETIKVCFVTEDKLIFRIITTCDTDAEHSIDESEGKNFLISKKDGKHKLYIGELKEEAHTEAQLLQQGFEELSKSSPDNFENSLEKLSAEKKSNVKDGAKAIFRKLIEIYRSNKEKFQLNEREITHQAFTYGFFMLNCKNRYLIDCLLEFRTGRGFADLVLISRKDHEDFNATPMIVEFKVNNTTASEAIEQIRNKGYAFTSLGIRIKAKQFVALGVNYNKSEEEQLAVESHESIQPKGFLRLLLQKLSCVKTNEMGEESKFLYYSIPRRKNGCFTGIALGQALCEYISNKKGPFEMQISFNKKKNDDDEVKTSFLITKDNKKFILNITEYKDSNYSPRLDSDDYSEDSDVSTASESTENTNDEAINIRIHSTAEEFNSYCKINYNHDEGYTLNKKIIYSAQDCSIDKIIEEMKAGKSDTLGEALFPIKKFITCESDLQAVMQGLFMHAKIKNNVDIIAHTEFSSCGSGRADLVLHFLKDGKETSDPIIMELKYCDEVKNLKSKMEEAEVQLEEYTKHFKFFTNLENVNSLAITFNKHANSSKKLIALSNKGVEAPHSSQGSTLLSPPKPTTNSSSTTKSDIYNDSGFCKEYNSQQLETNLSSIFVSPERKKSKKVGIQ